MMSASAGTRPAPDEPGWIRVDLWSSALRFQHWASVLLIVIMSATGWYIMDPFFGPQPGAPGETGYLMGWIRFTHILAGFLWCGLALARLFLLFFAKGRQSRWKALWPLYTKRDVRHLWETTQFYLFLRKEGPLFLTHNPLQQISYTGVYVMCLLQVLTGLALYGLYDQSNWFLMVLSYPVHWLGVPVVRLIHAIIMFLLWVFVVIHVYLVLRADAVEKHAGLSAMVNGGMWIRSDAKPVDIDRVGP